MLQQTRVDRVLRKWAQFLELFPTPAACAESSLGDILRVWQGLGYPRRAGNLHAAARELTRCHGGQVPADLDQLLALPGIGRYTARAVLVFAFEHDVGVVDTNIARVLARATGTRLTPSRAQAIADELVPEGEGWLWNQVLMDLGAMVCRRNPTCDECPVADCCAWFLAGRIEPDPATGSAGVSSRQAPYEGSDRQLRGEVLRLLGGGPGPAGQFDERIIAGLERDGLVERTGELLHLPH